MVFRIRQETGMDRCDAHAGWNSVQIPRESTQPGATYDTRTILVKRRMGGVA